MLYTLISIIGIFLTIFFVIGTHESAHFFTARLLGVKVLRFSIGFGKTLLRWQDKKGTEYVFALIPLGGYVKMLDEHEGEVPPQELAFAYNRQPFYKKFLIVLAGPLSNMVCAFLLYWLIFVIGFVSIKPIIGEVTPQSIAALGGLKKNQEIISIDNKTTSTWTSILFNLLMHAGNQDQLLVSVKNITDQKITTHSLNLSKWELEGLKPDPLNDLGIKPYQPTIPLVIGILAEKSPAISSSLKIGDEITAINHQPIKDWVALTTFINEHPDKTILFTVKRQGKLMDLPVTIGSKQVFFSKKIGYLGIAPHFEWPKDLLSNIKYSPLAAIPRAWQQMYDLTYFNLMLFGKLFTGKLSLQSLGGPITIFESAGNALNYGFLSFLSFLAFLSISVGIINFLPIPGLDGGHLFIQIIELVTRKSLSEKTLDVLYRLGFVFLIFVLFQAVINDLLRLTG